MKTQTNPLRPCASAGEPTHVSDFPPTFCWGAATASYQIEGAWDAEGKEPSVWDDFCRQPGKVFEGHTGDVACDHYHRWREDVDLMQKLGLNAYRFSVSWPRVLSSGTGSINTVGLDFYDALVDRLLAANVQPWVTLYHWELPLALHHRGGWLNRDIHQWFADYTRVVVDRLSDRVQHWFTLNEPQCFIGFGYGTGMHAPGLKLSNHEQLRAGHHALMAHGAATQVIRNHAKLPPKVGWAPVGFSFIPDSDSAEDIAATRRRVLSAADGNVWNNTWWNDPVFFGHYPEDGLRAIGTEPPGCQPGDLEWIHQKPDFFGANIYTAVARIRDDGRGGWTERTHACGIARTAFNWAVTPEAMYWTPKFLHERYQTPVYITENGMAAHDWGDADGSVQDPQRIDFIRRHLHELRRAMADGVDVRGYFYWSLMDNFEWQEGYSKRFGLVHVDYATGERTPKASALWYADQIRASRGEMGSPGDHKAT